MKSNYSKIVLNLTYEELMEIAEVTAGLFALRKALRTEYSYKRMHPIITDLHEKLERVYDKKLQELVR